MANFRPDRECRAGDYSRHRRQPHRRTQGALKADRLVITRQGAGAFVLNHVRPPYRVDFDEHSSLHDVLNVLELRTGVEVEAVGLATERASRAG
jgi:GntR family transcriptional regulator, transcriptional repressor for pyruvate dehydrogenase complex